MNPAELRRVSSVRAIAARGEAQSIRISRHLSLKEVADAIGVSVSTIHRWEAGQSVPTAVPALRWAEVMDLSETHQPVQVVA